MPKFKPDYALLAAREGVNLRNKLKNTNIHVTTRNDPRIYKKFWKVLSEVNELFDNRWPVEYDADGFPVE